MTDINKYWEVVVLSFCCCCCCCLSKQSGLRTLDNLFLVVTEFSDQIPAMAGHGESGSALSLSGSVSDRHPVVAHPTRLTADSSGERLHICRLHALEVPHRGLVVSGSLVVTRDTRAAARDAAASELPEESTSDRPGGSCDERGDSLAAAQGSLSREGFFLQVDLLDDVYVCNR